MPPIGKVVLVMLVIAAGAAGWYAWRKRKRDDIAVAVFLLGTAVIEMVRWGVDGAAPLSAGWYADAALLLMEVAAPTALALFVLARWSLLPAAALLAVSLLTLALNPRSVTWLYAVAEAAAAAMAVLCVVRLWRRRARVSFAVFITLLFVAVSSLGAAGGAINVSNALIWRAHIAAEVCIFMFAAAFYLRGSLGNGEAS